MATEITPPVPPQPPAKSPGEKRPDFGGFADQPNTETETDSPAPKAD